MARVAIGLVQMTSLDGDLEANRERTLQALRAAFVEGADLVILPELVTSGYPSGGPRGFADEAETVPGPSTAAWTDACTEFGTWMCGGLAEREGDALYDTAVIVGPEGIVTHYRKLHLFAEEKHTFRPGNLGLPIATLPFGTVGTLICYDLRFPEAVRVLALLGVDLICLPAAWVAGFDQRPRSRTNMPTQADTAVVQANLNQVFIAASSQVGVRDNHTFLGASLVVDPRGQVLAGPLSDRDEETLVREVDLAEAKRAQVRSELVRPRADRRPDVYAIKYRDREL